jgi:hypothetical protein
LAFVAKKLQKMHPTIVKNIGKVCAECKASTLKGAREMFNAKKGTTAVTTKFATDQERVNFYRANYLKAVVDVWRAEWQKEFGELKNDVSNQNQQNQIFNDVLQYLLDLQ